jgi:hypothetical protein
MRSLKKEVLKHKRQRNLAISECSHRRLEIAILMSTWRALEVRLELSAEALKSAMMLNEPVQPDAVPEELARVREALRVSGERASLLGQQLLQSEQREQKLLKDLKTKNERVTLLVWLAWLACGWVRCAPSVSCVGPGTSGGRGSQV